MAITSTGAIYYFKDDLGNPLVGGKVYTYEYNTSQPKDTYQTGSRITPHTNPVILNDSGSVEWYLKDNYTLRVYDANDVFLEEQHIVAPAKAQVDVVSDKLDTLISDLKEGAYRSVGKLDDQLPANSDLGAAAYKAVGKASGQIPLNSDLGTASTKDVGGASSQIPLNSDLGSLAYIDKNEDENGFLRASGKNKDALVANSSGGLSIPSIQAGAGAPKLAYKSLSGTTGATNKTVSIAHGLFQTRIYDAVVSIRGNDANLVTSSTKAGIGNSFLVDIKPSTIDIFTNSNATNIASRPFKVLITYEA